MGIAGHTARVTPLFSSTREYFRRYLTDGPAEFSVTVTREDIAFEQADLLEEARREGFRPRVFTDPFLERAAIQRAFAEYLFDHDILMLHGSAVALDGKGYLFAARSGTGKSTHTRMWLDRFGERAFMINDDKPFIRLSGDEPTIYGSPWSGKHGLDTNTCVPLRGICLLERGKENIITPAQASQLLPILAAQGYCPLGLQRQERYPQLLRQLLGQVPLWHLRCTPTPQAAEIAASAMAGTQ